MDRLPWARFHWMVVVGLGVSWILDGLEIQLVASAGFQHSLGMSTEQVAFAGTIYLIGQVVGALTLGPDDRRLGPQEALHPDARHLPRRQRRRRPGDRTSGSSISGASSPASASAANTPRSILPSTS